MPDCAVLILSARAPRGLGALARYFSKLTWDVFVHVDAKVDVEQFKEATASYNDALVFVPNRIKVYWGGFSMVEATIGLIHAAIEKGNYRRYLLISDDSLPLIEPELLEGRLSDSTEFTDARPSTYFRFRYDNFFMFDSGATSAPWVPLEQKAFFPGVFDRMVRVHAASLRGKVPLPTLFHGSQWWCLTDQAIQHVLDSWKSDLWFRESFEFSQIPDEHYVQTIIGTRMQIEPVWFMYTDWSDVEKPKIFTELEQVSPLRDTGALFFRKANFSDDQLGEYIDKLIR